MPGFTKPLRGLLVSATLLAGLFIYVGLTCSGPREKRPFSGDFIVHYTWDHGITAMEVTRVGTPRELDDPISRILIPRMVRSATEKQVVSAMERIGRVNAYADDFVIHAMQDRPVVHGYADAYVRVYGDILPCSISEPKVVVKDFDHPRSLPNR